MSHHNIILIGLLFLSLMPTGLHIRWIWAIFVSRNCTKTTLMLMDA